MSCKKGIYSTSHYEGAFKEKCVEERDGRAEREKLNTSEQQQQ